MRSRPVIIPYDSSWPLWARALITVFALGLFAVLAWRYYRAFTVRR
jgi:hypothetical protein